MTQPAPILLWTASSGACIEAIAAAGLSDRVAIDTPGTHPEAPGGATRPDRGADGGSRSPGPAAGDAEAALGPSDDGGRRGLAGFARSACTLDGGGKASLSFSLPPLATARGGGLPIHMEAEGVIDTQSDPLRPSATFPGDGGGKAGLARLFNFGRGQRIEDDGEPLEEIVDRKAGY